MPPKFLPFSALKDRGIPLSQCQLWRLERAGKFPKRIRLSTHRHAWIEDEIDEYLAGRIAASRGVAA